MARVPINEHAIQLVACGGVLSAHISARSSPIYTNEGIEAWCGLRAFPKIEYELLKDYEEKGGSMLRILIL